MDDSIRPLTPQEQAHSEQLNTYRKLLAAHDWHYGYSDDPRSYRAGRAQRQTLEELQADIDPDSIVWNELAPAEFRRALVAA